MDSHILRNFLKKFESIINNSLTLKGKFDHLTHKQTKIKKLTHGVRPSNLWPSIYPSYPKYPYLLITKHMGHQWSISCSLSALSLSLTKIILSVSALSKIEVVRPDLVYVQRDLRFFSFVIGVLCIFKLSAMSTSICFHFCTLFV